VEFGSESLFVDEITNPNRIITTFTYFNWIIGSLEGLKLGSLEFSELPTLDGDIVKQQRTQSNRPSDS